MEYNRAKKILDRIAGIFSIISAIAVLIASLIVLLMGALPYLVNGHIYLGLPVLAVGLGIMVLGILLLVFSIKLVKSPLLPDGELRKKQGARIFILIVAILSCDLVIMGLLIASLCLKDFKEPKAQSAQGQYPANQGQFYPVMQIPMNDYYEFYTKIEEAKRLRSMGIIDDLTFKKAVSRVVSEMINK